MPRHYFRDSQFEIPTRAVWESVYDPLGFDAVFPTDPERHGYEALRQEYEALRNYHRCDDGHCNVWKHPPVPSTGRLHPCQKPTDLLARIIRVSCPEGGVVLDPFMGSGSTAVACVETGRQYIGFERDPKTHQVCQDRLAEHQEVLPL